jgi:hypothetical protein
MVDRWFQAKGKLDPNRETRWMNELDQLRVDILRWIERTMSGDFGDAINSDGRPVISAARV